MASRGQTLTTIRQLLSEHGLRPHTGLGQNFLIDLNLLDVLVERAELTSDDVVLEVGAGTGSLARRLVERAGWVVAVELDRGMFELARHTVGDAPNATWLCADILQTKHQTNPEVIGAVEAACDRLRSPCRKLVANLPYSVATPLLVNLLVGPPVWERFVVTVQREVADRMVARPRTGDYGSLAVIVQALAEVEIFRELPPSAFWPRPKVASAMVCIRPNAEKRRAVGDAEVFAGFVRAQWQHRRKNLRTSLHRAWNGHRTKSEVDAFLTANGFDGDDRPEAISVVDFVRLAQAARATPTSAKYSVP